eukprot:10226074-Karenia_brevis.AAC.1
MTRINGGSNSSNSGTINGVIKTIRTRTIGGLVSGRINRQVKVTVHRKVAKKGGKGDANNQQQEQCPPGQTK